MYTPVGFGFGLGLGLGFGLALLAFGVGVRYALVFADAGVTAVHAPIIRRRGGVVGLIGLAVRVSHCGWAGHIWWSVSSFSG